MSYSSIVNGLERVFTGNYHTGEDSNTVIVKEFMKQGVMPDLPLPRHPPGSFDKPERDEEPSEEIIPDAVSRIALPYIK